MINDRLSRDNTYAVGPVVLGLFIFLSGSHTLKTYGNTWLLKGGSRVSGLWAMNNYRSMNTTRRAGASRTHAVNTGSPALYQLSYGTWTITVKKGKRLKLACFRF